MSSQKYIDARFESLLNLHIFGTSAPQHLDSYIHYSSKYQTQITNAEMQQNASNTEPNAVPQIDIPKFL
jgi:hypothetical protein